MSRFLVHGLHVQPSKSACLNVCLGRRSFSAIAVQNQVSCRLGAPMLPDVGYAPTDGRVVTTCPGLCSARASTSIAKPVRHPAGGATRSLKSGFLGSENSVCQEVSLKRDSGSKRTPVVANLGGAGVRMASVRSAEASLVARTLEEQWIRETEIYSVPAPLPLAAWLDTLSPDILAVLDRIHTHGGKAYLVGGCVRDAICGVVPREVDITTNLHPEQMLEIFGDAAEETGSRFGCVTVHHGTAILEITTLRRDGDYKDSRRPESVVYTEFLVEDLARRDFTINAMAVCARSRRLYDPFGGMLDAMSNVLRCVGADRSRHLSEDGLRVWRAYRFLDAGRRGVRYVERSTLDALHNPDVVKAAGAVAMERVWKELSKILVGIHACDVLALMARTGVLQLALPDTGIHAGSRGVVAQKYLLREWRKHHAAHPHHRQSRVSFQHLLEELSDREMRGGEASMLHKGYLLGGQLLPSTATGGSVAGVVGGSSADASAGFRPASSSSGSSSSSSPSLPVSASSLSSMATAAATATTATAVPMAAASTTAASHAAASHGLAHAHPPVCTEPVNVRSLETIACGEPLPSCHPLDRVAQKYRSFVVLDLQATCCAKMPGSGSELSCREIIEFPAILLQAQEDGSLRQVSEFNTFCRPARHPVLTPYCLEVTGIAQSTVDKGIPLGEALERFTGWLMAHGAGSVEDTVVVTCSDWDIKSLLAKQCESEGLPLPPIFDCWVNAQISYREHYLRPRSSLLLMLSELGLPFNGYHLRGMDNVRAAAAVACRLAQDGCVFTPTTWRDGTCHYAGEAPHLAIARLALLLGMSGPRAMERDLKNLRVRKDEAGQIQAITHMLGRLPDPASVEELRVYRCVLGQHLCAQLVLEAAWARSHAELSGDYSGVEKVERVETALRQLPDLRAGSTPLVSGDFLMERLGLRTGMKLGRLKEWLFRLQVEKDLACREEVCGLLDGLDWQMSDPKAWPSLTW
eukprot:jgi/Mesvir1/24395/Mv11063-RA.1